jgi:hypothetical protein
MAVVKVSSANLTLNAIHSPAHKDNVMARNDALGDWDPMITKTYATVQDAKVKTSAGVKNASKGIARRRRLNLATLFP